MQFAPAMTNEPVDVLVLAMGLCHYWVSSYHCAPWDCVRQLWTALETVQSITQFLELARLGLVKCLVSDAIFLTEKERETERERERERERGRGREREREGGTERDRDRERERQR